MTRPYPLVVLLILASCVGNPVTSAVLPGAGSVRDPGIADLPRCEWSSSTASADDWRTVEAPEGEFTFKLPRGFLEVESPQGFVHGGTLWREGQTTVSLRYGHWGLSSFDGAGERCVTEVGGFEAVVIRFDTPTPSLVFWFLDSGPAGGHELVMGLNGASAEEQDLLLSIGRSVSRART